MKIYARLSRSAFSVPTITAPTARRITYASGSTTLMRPSPRFVSPRIPICRIAHSHIPFPVQEPSSECILRGQVIKVSIQDIFSTINCIQIQWHLKVSWPFSHRLRFVMTARTSATTFLNVQMLLTRGDHIVNIIRRLMSASASISLTKTRPRYASGQTILTATRHSQSLVLLTKLFRFDYKYTIVQ